MKAGGSGITHASTLEEIKEDFMNVRRGFFAIFCSFSFFVNYYCYLGSADSIYRVIVMQLMGSDSEGCEEQGEECLKRRMIADAHLDYIYTQHHKP